MPSKALPSPEELLPHVVSDKDPAWRYVRDRQNALKRGDWLTMVIVVGLVVCMVEPNINGAIKNSQFGKFFRAVSVSQASSQAKAAPTPTKSFFPLADTAPAKANIRDRVGSIRPLGCKKNCRRHEGVDYAYKGRIVAALSGKIVELKPDAESGGAIGIESRWQGKTVSIRYLHLDRQPLRKFRRSQSVEAGALLSKVSTTFPGSSGPHPHIEVWVDGRLHQKPEEFLAGLGGGINQGMGGWTKPTEGVLTQKFHSYHEGIDIAGAVGTPVRAARDGTVTFAAWHDWGLGNAISLEHGENQSIYGHLSKILVRPQERVEAGQVIGLMGFSGNSYVVLSDGSTKHGVPESSHLHFEWREKKQAQDPCDILFVCPAIGGSF